MNLGHRVLSSLIQDPVAVLGFWGLCQTLLDTGGPSAWPCRAQQPGHLEGAVLLTEGVQKELHRV